jgi:hypothetical protein
MATAALPEPPDTGWFKRWVDFGSLIKTAIGLLIALGAGGFFAYNHFAKAAQITALQAELDELRENATCALTMDNVIAQKAIEVSRQVREGLRGMEASGDFAALQRELAKSVPKVDQALRELEVARDQRINNTLAFKGSERCRR